MLPLFAWYAHRSVYAFDRSAMVSGVRPSSGGKVEGLVDLHVDHHEVSVEVDEVGVGRR